MAKPKVKHAADVANEASIRELALGFAVFHFKDGERIVYRYPFDVCKTPEHALAQARWWRGELLKSNPVRRPLIYALTERGAPLLVTDSFTW